VSHVRFEDWVAYFAGDHPDEAALEEHAFACAECTREGERVAAVTERLRAEIPHVLDRARLARLRGKGLCIADMFVSPGERIDATFPADLDLLIFHLGGVELSDADRVEVTVRVESDGRVLSHLPQAAFDPDAGEILVACQRAFADLPPDAVMEVAVHAGTEPRRHVYTIVHHFR
jgi:hypothetical protein